MNSIILFYFIFYFFDYVLCDESLSNQIYDHKKSGDIVKYKEWKGNNNELSRIQFSREPNGYKVSIELKKSECNINDRNDKFNSSDLFLMDENNIGPDEIIVLFEGASIQAQVAQSSDYCNNYYALFQVPITGVYRLKIIRLRKNYEASLDTLFNPGLSFEILLDTKVDENLGFYAPVPCNRDVQGYWVTRIKKHLLLDSKNIKDQCKGDDYKQGSPLSTNVILHESFTNIGCAYDISNFGWNRKICKHSYQHFADGFGEGVSHIDPNIQYTRSYDYFKRRKILFLGDSHMLSLASIFVGHVCRYDENTIDWNHTTIKLKDFERHEVERPFMKLYLRAVDYDNYRDLVQICHKYADINDCPKFKTLKDKILKDKIKSCYQSRNSSSCELFDLDCLGSTISYINVLDCQSNIVDQMEGYDYVVFNCGNHYLKHSTYSKFREVIKGLSNSIIESKLPDNSYFFYVENTAVPLRQDADSKAELDKRTYHRSIMYDAIAKHEIQKAGLQVRYINAFYSTLALFDKFCECGNYPRSAKMPQLFSLIENLNRAISKNQVYKEY